MRTRTNSLAFLALSAIAASAQAAPVAVAARPVVVARPAPAVARPAPAPAPAVAPVAKPAAPVAAKATAEPTRAAQPAPVIVLLATAKKGDDCPTVPRPGQIRPQHCPPLPGAAR